MQFFLNNQQIWTIFTKNKHSTTQLLLKTVLCLCNKISITKQHKTKVKPVLPAQTLKDAGVGDLSVLETSYYLLGWVWKFAVEHDRVHVLGCHPAEDGTARKQQGIQCCHLHPLNTTWYIIYSLMFCCLFTYPTTWNYFLSGDNCQSYLPIYLSLLTIMFYILSKL